MFFLRHHISHELNHIFTMKTQPVISVVKYDKS